MRLSYAVFCASWAALSAIALPGPALLAQDLSAAFYAPPKEGGARRWQSTGATPLRQAANEEANILLPLSAGAVLRNLGCQPSAEQMWCKVQPLQGGVKGFVPANTLSVVRGPSGAVITGPDDSKRRARKRDFDASADVACAQERGEALGTCSASVARGLGGDATVVVSFANGFSRMLFFAHWEFLSASATMSGVGTDTDWRLENGRYEIRVDDQQFLIPDVLIFGP